MGVAPTYFFFFSIFHCIYGMELTLCTSTPKTSIFALCPLHIPRSFVATLGRPGVQLFISLTLDLRLLFLVLLYELIRRLHLRRAVTTARRK